MDKRPDRFQQATSAIALAHIDTVEPFRTGGCLAAREAFREVRMTTSLLERMADFVVDEPSAGAVVRQ